MGKEKDDGNMGKWKGELRLVEVTLMAKVKARVKAVGRLSLKVR